MERFEFCGSCWRIIIIIHSRQSWRKGEKVAVKVEQRRVLSIYSAEEGESMRDKSTKSGTSKSDSWNTKCDHTYSLIQTTVERYTSRVSVGRVPSNPKHSQAKGFCGDFPLSFSSYVLRSISSWHQKNFCRWEIMCCIRETHLWGWWDDVTIHNVCFFSCQNPTRLSWELQICSSIWEAQSISRALLNTVQNRRPIFYGRITIRLVTVTEGY